MALSKVGCVIAVSALVIFAPASASSKRQSPPSPKDFVGIAEDYVTDSLLDPTSALFRHVTETRTSPRDVSVCGYVWAKNGSGQYHGSSRFVVGLENGKPVGSVSELGGATFALEERAAISSYGDAICTMPFSELYRHVREMTTAEIEADQVAKGDADRCEQQKNAQEDAIHGETGFSDPTRLNQILKDSIACFAKVATAHRAAYSRILGYDYSGPMGLHSPGWIYGY